MSCLWPDPAIYISNSPPAGYKKKRERLLAVMGSTGSIGRNVLAVAQNAGGSLRPAALAAGRNMELLARQANYWHPEWLACQDGECAQKLRPLLAYSPNILTGQEGYAAMASLAGIDCVVSAQSGAAGLACTLAAALAGKVIALANKESLVLAGGLLRRICAGSGSSILPVDSEHFAIFQCLAGRPATEIKKLVLTASGGPFWGKSAKDMALATPQDALKHPKWNMGAKITIDSATLMNKGLEFMEAMQLYGMGASQIGVLVHPQSIIHSLVEFKDNGMLAQLARPDMRLPIAACLLWPHAEQSFVKELDLPSAGPLSFFMPDFDAFPCLRMAIEASQHEASASWTGLGLNPAAIALNAANEVAVALFLAKKCLFGQIAEIIQSVMRSIVYEKCPLPPNGWETGDTVENALGLAAVIAGVDAAARKLAADYCG